MIRRVISRAHAFARPHAGQALRYLLSGGAATVCSLAAYQFLLVIGLWYIHASIAADAVGLVCAFLFHKYLVFGKHQRFFKHIVRYSILQAGNFVVQTGLVYVFVEFMGVDEFFAKVLSIACAVCWNFVLYKIFVYV